MLTYTIRKNEYGEYVVRFSIDGKRATSMDYFTNDRQDATVTAKQEYFRYASKPISA